MLNQFTLIGRMAKSPLLQTTREGVSYTRFTLAVRRPFKNPSGTYDTDFIQLVSWNKLAETVADYCTKGSLISVSGRLQMRSIEFDNQKRLTIPDVIAENVTFLAMKKMSEQEQQVHIPPKPKEEHPPSQSVQTHGDSHPTENLQQKVPSASSSSSNIQPQSPVLAETIPSP
ncbi:single-stranded DNA-binding protein [Salipaludibacillus keqinensis]|uniref:Single-stranded DNA-binding protein n=1 Tax=Salipaludibacillus keqinensis TaxID=2045207 RepID=A0A323TBV3_9BACI|nr:single-stranded DNA-binding protein [Salipaludibacillus keqinensis]PYZ92822.1 single-stranded DNA-binding protein [Salipaludibacillus keqinensis]